MKHYLGDGVYIEINDDVIKLTTSNGVIDTNTIYLEDFVIQNLVEYLKKYVPSLVK